MLWRVLRLFFSAFAPPWALVLGATSLGAIFAGSVAFYTGLWVEGPEVAVGGVPVVIVVGVGVPLPDSCS